MDKILSRIEKTDTCWNWTGYIDKQSGYGTVTIKGKNYRAHRVVYELLVGKIPDGLHTDHLCRNRKCVNPAHLEPVTIAENNRRCLKDRYTSRLGAINYLLKYNVYTDDRSGAEMYKIIVQVMDRSPKDKPPKGGFTRKELDSFLENAKNPPH